MTTFFWSERNYSIRKLLFRRIIMNRCGQFWIEFEYIKFCPDGVKLFFYIILSIFCNRMMVTRIFPIGRVCLFPLLLFT